MAAEFEKIIRDNCFPKEGESSPPMSFGSILEALTDTSSIPPCLETPAGKIALVKYKATINPPIPSSKFPSSNSSNSSKSNSPSAPQVSTNSSSKPQNNSQKPPEESGPGFFNSLKGSLKGSLSALTGKKEDDEKKLDDEKKPEDEKDESGDKIVNGVEELFKSKITKNWFDKQKDIFLGSKDQNGTSTKELINDLLYKSKDPTKISTEDAKKYISLYLSSFYSEINDVNKVNVIENLTVILLDHIFKDVIQTGGGRRIYNRNYIGGVDKQPQNPVKNSSTGPPNPAKNNSAGPPNPAKNNSTVPPNPAKNNSNGGPNSTKTGSLSNSELLIVEKELLAGISNSAKKKSEVPNATKTNSGVPNSVIGSKKITEQIFNNLVKKFKMYSYPLDELKILNKTNKEEDKKNKENAQKSTMVIPSADDIGDAARITTLIPGGSSHTKVTRHFKLNHIDKNAKIPKHYTLKNITLKDDVKNRKGGLLGITLSGKFWTNNKSEDKNVLLIDIIDENIDKSKHNELNSNIIANSIIEFLDDDVLASIKPLIDEKDYGQIAIDTKYISNLKSQNSPAPIKGGAPKDETYLLNDEQTRKYVKLLLQSIKFMFELSISKPSEKGEVKEHKLNPIIEKLIGDSYTKLISEIPLYDKSDENKNSIKLNSDDLKNAFRCLITAILTKPLQEFPLIPKISEKKYKDNEKNEKFYLLYDISKKGMSTLGSCKIVIQNPNMTENELYKEIKDFSETEITKFDQDLNKQIKKYQPLPTPENHEANLLFKIFDAVRSKANESASTLKGGAKQKKYVNILGRKRIIITKGRSRYIRYKNNYITLTEAKSIEKKTKSSRKTPFNLF